MKHWHMKINEMVILYIDKNEKDPSYPRFEWPTVDPKYSTLKEISKMYCHMMCGRGRVASRRFCTRGRKMIEHKGSQDDLLSLAHHTRAGSVRVGVCI
jgi:hypothetical protein